MKYLIERTIYWTLEVEADSLEDASTMDIDTSQMFYQGEDDEVTLVEETPC